MKDRIVFFVLGAVVATVAYFAGDMDRADAQGRDRFFGGDVFIKGRLTVSSGEFFVTYDPRDTHDMAKIDSSVGIIAGEDSASILLNKGPYNSLTEKFPASLILTINETNESKVYSIISLAGDYDRDIYHISSNDGLVKVK